MCGCIEVFLKLKHQVHWETRRRRLDSVVQDEIKLVEARIKVWLASGIEADGIGHAVRGKDAIGELREEAVSTRGATRALARCGEWAESGCTGGASERTRVGCLHRKRTRVEQG